MFEKISENILLKRMPVQVLNKPTNWEIFDCEGNLSISNFRIASIEKSDDVGGFDLKEALKEHPDHLFIKVFAIKEAEVNDNGDEFSGEELEKSAHTFIGVPLFCNHANDDIEKARGKVVHAWYDKKDGGIYIVAMVDRVAYPKLARGIEEGYITGTSMGCQVHHSYCSICHNMAHTADEYCDHVKHRKTKKFSGKVKCAYHKSKCKPDGDCPVCQCKPGDEKQHEYKDAQIHEKNIGLKFIENSFVVNPACHTCGVSCILNGAELNKKVASLRDNVSKMANWIGGERLLKIAGKQEVDYLNQAMKMMEVVAKSMMDQKDQVSMEYVSDIVDVLASLQTATDELVEMGYAQIPSPPTLQAPEGLGDAVPTPTTPQNQQQQQPPVPQMPQPSGAVANPAGSVGTVTKPSFSPSATGKLKDLFKDGGNLMKKISSLGDIAANSQKESNINMSNNEKIAAGAARKEEHQHVTTEKQLADAKLDFHPRTSDAPDGVTQSDQQLGLSKEPVNDTTSKSPQVREDDYATVTTEGQLPGIEGALARWNEYPNVVTQKQWTDFTRLVGAILDRDQSEHTTEAQLQDLVSHHRWVEPNVTTENQLKSDENWLNPDNAWLDKGASAAYAKKLVTAAVEAVSDAIALYHKTPDEVAKAASFITKDPQSQIKAAFLTLVNGVPANRKARKAEVARAAYFKKASNDSAVDVLLACMGDHCNNLKAEDFVDAVRYVATDKNRMSSVEEKAQTKLASVNNPSKIEVVDKFSAFDSAFKEMEQPEDGLYLVKAPLADIGVSPDNEEAFVAAATKLAKSHISNVETVLYSIELGDNGEVFTTLKAASKLTNEEKAEIEKRESSANNEKTRQTAREDVVKEAQMMGGELGGGMGGGAGQGASMPTPPQGAGGAPPVPPVESLQGDPTAEGDEGEEGGSVEAKPPGSICPVCGSEDVDIVEGKGKCNNCNSQFIFKVQIEVTRWTGVNDTNSDEGLGEGAGEAPMGGDPGTQAGEGFPMPEEGGDVPNIPVAAMTRLTPAALTKLAEANIELGSISPLTGTRNTFALGAGKRLCLDTGVTYEVLTAIDKKNVKNLYAEWRWSPKFANSECSSCRRAKKAWTEALKSEGMTDDQFENLGFLKKADAVIAMDKKGYFQQVKTASKNSSVIAEFKKAYTVNGKFPIESCREKLARRYGENAIAVSGPCKGDKLYDCVCNQLKNASVYNDDLALKVADSWKDRDSCLECMEDYVRFGYDLEKSATICQHLKLKYASPGHLFAEELGDTAPNPHDPNNSGGAPNAAPVDDMEADPFSDGGNEGGLEGGDPGMDAGMDAGMEGGAPGEQPLDLGDDMGGDMISDPITGEPTPMDVGAPGEGMGGGGGSEHGEVTIKLPLSALDAIEQAIDSAHGETPGDEAHHNLPPGQMKEEVEVALPEEAVEGLEGVAEDALDGAVDGGEGGEGEAQVDSKPSGDFGGEKSEGDGGGHGGPPEQKEPDVADNNEFKEGEDADHFAHVMRRGNKRVGEIDLDVASIMKAITKADKVKYEPAQDTVGKIQDGGTIGNENKFKADKPNVPTGGAKAEIGDETHPPEIGVEIPSGDGSMGHEKELGYTADNSNATGGDKGQGKTPTASGKKPFNVAVKTQIMPSSLPKKADGMKTVKVGPAKPVSEQTEVDFSANKDHKNTPEGMKRTPFEEKDKVSNIPEKGEGAFIGDEKTSIGDVPKADQKFAPQIPAGGGRNPDYDRNEKNTPEMLGDIKGTRIAKGDEKAKAVEAEAIRIAGRMIEAKLIDAKDLMKKIAELKQYQLPQLADIEKAIFKSAAKGLALESDGVEGSPVIISETSSQRSGTPDLTQQLKSLFKLDQQNRIASELTEADLRKRHFR
jgi:hypothetical protein